MFCARSTEQYFDLGLERWPDVRPRERIGDIRRQKADLGTGVVDLAVEAVGEEGLSRCRGEADHRIGELDFVAGTLLLLGKKIEDLRLQNIAADDGGVSIQSFLSADEALL